MTYDNTDSGLASTDVQGAIDELYDVCSTNSTGFTINVLSKKVEISISCDGSGNEFAMCPNGLYQDYKDKNRYVYRGKNPNNYITFNNEKAGWRIISVEADGTVKIIHEASIGNRQWHNKCGYRYDVCHNWTSPASLNTYLNSTYYNGLSSVAQSQIVSKNYSVLKTSSVGQNSTEIWNGKVALPMLTDLYYSTGALNYCSNPNYFRTSICHENSWMVNNFDWWLLDVPSGGLNNSNNSCGYIYNNTNSSLVEVAYANVTQSYAVRPTVYLSSSVKITGGTGTKTDPYTIS